MRLRIRSRFHPLMELWHHPVRLTVSLLLILFLLPEAAMLGQKAADLPAYASYMLGTLAVFLLVIAPQFCAAYLNCRHVRYDFFDDHLCFTESILLRDKIRIQYKSISAVRWRQASLQKPLRLADIIIETRPRGMEDMRGAEYMIIDVRAARTKVEKINALLDAWRQSAAAPASSASGDAGAISSDRR